MRSRQAARRGVGAGHEPQTRHEDGKPSTTNGVWPRAQRSPTTDGQGDRSWRLSSIASIPRQAQPAWSTSTTRWMPPSWSRKDVRPPARSTSSPSRALTRRTRSKRSSFSRAGGGRRAGMRPERCSRQPRWLATSASGSHGGGCPSTQSSCPSSPGLLHTALRRSSASWASGRRTALRPPPRPGCPALSFVIAASQLLRWLRFAQMKPFLLRLNRLDSE